MCLIQKDNMMLRPMPVLDSSQINRVFDQMGNLDVDEYLNQHWLLNVYWNPLLCTKASSGTEWKPVVAGDVSSSEYIIKIIESISL